VALMGCLLRLTASGLDRGLGRRGSELVRYVLICRTGEAWIGVLRREWGWVRAWRAAWTSVGAWMRAFWRGWRTAEAWTAAGAFERRRARVERRRVRGRGSGEEGSG
jgi:hypothetical protein